MLYGLQPVNLQPDILDSIDTKQHPSMSQRKKLPIGVQTFQKIREGNYYYVDKTPLILNLKACC